jgi:hypothetical protein
LKWEREGFKMQVQDKHQGKYREMTRVKIKNKVKTIKGEVGNTPFLKLGWKRGGFKG